MVTSAVKRVLGLGCAGVLCAATPPTGSASLSPVTATAMDQRPSGNAVLPSNSEITLVVNDEITTKGNRWHAGDTFDLTVSRPVRLGRYVVIPKGARAVGRITWMTDKGAFGKSGKMEVDIEYVEIGDQRLPLAGHFRQEGEGNTVATVGAVVAVGVFSALVTGRSGVIPAGRELVARTKADLPVVLPDVQELSPPQTIRPAAVQSPQPVVAVPPPADTRRRKSSAPVGNAHVRCITCQ